MAHRRMTRMISFRVSEDEFEQLRARSMAEGARSVSDYARLALSRESTDTSELMERLHRLSCDVSRLTTLLTEVKPRDGHETIGAGASGRWARGDH